MAQWTVIFRPKALKALYRLDSVVQQSILDYMGRVVAVEDPTMFGKPLIGELSGYWRYRVGKYRVICEIKKKQLIIEIIKVDKRDKVYG